ncbi:MAG: ADP-dependent glucokinase/phosphofructokinase [Candidatus Nanohaloarchaea archaeon]
MPGPVEAWRQSYREASKLVKGNVEVLTGFNANIDVIHRNFNTPDEEPELYENVESREQLLRTLRYCLENSENREVECSGVELEGEMEKVGGQAAIFSNFIAGTGNTVIFYTPFLSRELAEEMDEKILFPVEEKGEFYLKNVQDAVNSDKTKKNHIFEFNSGDRSGRLILSGSIKGFGPYFESSVESNMALIESNIDCCILSGFHDADGNAEAKLEKSARQLSEIEPPIHIEYVHDEDTAAKIIEDVVPGAESLGIDETELAEILDLMGEDGKKPFNFGEAFSALTTLIEQLGVSRIHLHTYRYHLCVAREDYTTEVSRIRDSMLFGELAAIQLSENGEIPGKKGIEDFEPDYSMNGIESMRNFGEYHGLEDFQSKGIAKIDGFKLAGIPTLINEDPERTVGMGDIISSGAFSSEFKSFD